MSILIAAVDYCEPTLEGTSECAIPQAGRYGISLGLIAINADSASYRITHLTPPADKGNLPLTTIGQVQSVSPEYVAESLEPWASVHCQASTARGEMIDGADNSAALFHTFIGWWPVFQGDCVVTQSGMLEGVIDVANGQRTFVREQGDGGWILSII